jgi:nucleoside-diphosphate-sugar epimerase
MSIDQAFAGKRVLVTGGLGFIGSNLARRLVEAGAKVTIVDNLHPTLGGNPANIAGLEGRLDTYLCSMEDTPRLPRLVEAADFIFNLAGQTSHQGSIDEPITDARLNCLAQLALLEACRHGGFAGKIVFSSTRQIYGRPRYLPVDEAHPVAPVDINGVHKQACELYHQLYGELHGLRSTIVRLTNTYGPGMRVKDASQIFLGLWIRLALEGRPFEVWGGGQLRDFTEVADAVEALLRVAVEPATDGQVYNLAGAETVTLRGLADLLAELGGAEFRVCEFSPERLKIDIGDFYADGSRLAAAVRRRPQVGLREGLARSLAWYRDRLAAYV